MLAITATPGGSPADAKTGQLLGMDVLSSQDAAAFVERPSRYVRDFGVESAVTDDLATHKPALEELGVDQRVCLTRVKKNVWNRLEKLDGDKRFRNLIWRLLDELPEDGGARLLRIEREARSDADLRRLAAELMENWLSLAHTAGDRGRRTPTTALSGRYAAARSDTRRRGGYKGESGMMNGLGLAQRVWSGYGLDAEELMAT